MTIFTKADSVIIARDRHNSIYDITLPIYAIGMSEDEAEKNLYAKYELYTAELIKDKLFTADQLEMGIIEFGTLAA